MATYKVKNCQNIYDVALHIYGSIEGVFDLLISNPTLSHTSVLKSGQELEYHEGFVINPSIVNQFEEDNITPVNGERSVYFKPTDEPLRGIIKIPANLDICSFSISGEGALIVDWGDNNDLEYINLMHQQSYIEHHFNNVVESRRIRLYGDFQVLQLDLSNLNGDLFLTRPLVIDEYVSQSNDNSLACLFLFSNTYKVDLRKSIIDDLSPIYSMSLSQLDLRSVRFQSDDILDNYLINIVKNHQNRRACEVWLDAEPTETGMEAIRTIIGEPDWNTPTKWVFHINNEIYTAE